MARRVQYGVSAEAFATRVLLQKADLCQHFTIRFFFVCVCVSLGNEALESDLIECFLLLSLSTFAPDQVSNRLLLPVSFNCLPFYDPFECAMLANQTVPITQCVLLE